MGQGQFSFRDLFLPTYPVGFTSEQMIMLVFARMVSICVTIIIIALSVIVVRDGNNALVNDVTSKLVDTAIAAISGLIAAYTIHLKLGNPSPSTTPTQSPTGSQSNGSNS